MKPNEAPEKIYLNQDDGLIWHCRSYKDDIEYTRTDVFIEKVLKFLDENFFFDNKRCSIESGVFDSKEEMFDDFKKYMND